MTESYWCVFQVMFDYAVKVLGESGVTEADMTGRNPLHLAAMTDNLEVARRLIQHGAKVNDPNTVNGTTLVKKSNNITRKMKKKCSVV